MDWGNLDCVPFRKKLDINLYLARQEYKIPIYGGVVW